MKIKHFQYSKAFMLLYFSILSATVTPLWAQYDAAYDNMRTKMLLQKKSVTPPSPGAADLGKFGDIPINNFTGALNLSIPIHTIKGNDIGTSVSLSYDGSGNKVETLPSLVGLGWSLNFGGVITRSIQGKPDRNNNYYSKANEIYNYPSDKLEEQQFYYKSAKAEIETQPDVYYFNFNGFSGKFVFTANKTIIMKDAKDLKIEPSWGGNNDISSFIITDIQGIKYYFDQVESTTLQYEYDNNPVWDLLPVNGNWDFQNIATAWYLTKIEAANNNESIEFAYQTTNQTVDYIQPKNAMAYATQSYRRKVQPTVDPLPTVSFSTNVNIPNKIRFRRFINTITYKLGTTAIEKIEFTNSPSNLTFNGVTVKTDVLKLDAIKLSVFNNMGAEKPLRKFNIIQNNPVTNRLTLNKIEEESLIETTLPKKTHEFAYQSTALPDIESNGIDHWGYYNGFNNNTGLIPSVTLNSPPNQMNFSGNNAIREPNINSLASLLIQVKYPTGGYSDIEHEQHTVAADNVGNPDIIVGGARVKEIKHYTSPGVLSHKKQFAYVKDNSPTSSGLLLGEIPTYFSLGKYTNYSGLILFGEMEKVDEYEIVNLSATSSTNLGSVQGSQVGYSRIEEITEGKTVYWYRAVKLDKIEWDDNDNGNLLKKQVFHLNGKKLSESEYAYVTDTRRSGQLTSYIITTEYLQNNLNILCKYNNTGGYEWRHPNSYNSYIYAQTCITTNLFSSKFAIAPSVTYRQSWKLMTQSINREYFYDAAWNLINTVVSTTNNTYGNSKVSAPTETTFTNSDNIVHKTKTYYTDDMVLPANSSQTTAGVLSTMVSKYMVAYPLRTEKYIGTTLANATEVVYDGFNTGQIFPKHLRLRDRNSTNWTTKYTIDTYNPVGQPTKVTMGGFAKSEYNVWERHLLKSKTFGDAPLVGLFSTYGYDDKDRPAYSINENGVRTNYEYDGLSRLKVIFNLLDATGSSTSAKAKTTMDYQYATGAGTFNYIKNSVWFNDASNSLLGTGNMFQTTQYFDGLGRAVQTVKEKYTQQNGHQKSFMTYDTIGRPNRSYQPIGSNIDGFEPFDQTLSRATKPYVNPIYEPSPLSRPEKQINEDASEVLTAYGSNTSGDFVRWFVLGANFSVQIGNYPVNQLLKTTITDENGNQTVVFKDKLGRVLLTRKIAESNQNVDTYNIYDDYGDLVIVVPPDAFDVVSGLLKPDLVFKYKYDNKHRLCEKKIPGADWQKFYYNVRDQLVLTQDGNMRNAAADRHLTTRYDDYGRVVETGWLKITPTPNASSDITTAINILPDSSLSQITYIAGKSLVGATKYRVLGYKKATDATWIHTYNYNYDAWARPIQTEGVNLHGQYEMNYTELTSSGWAWFKAHQFTGPDNQNRSTFTYNYHDHSMRQVWSVHKIALDNSWTNFTPQQPVSWHVYDHLDRLSQKRLGGAWAPANNDYRFSQNVNYEYNSRSWLTKINIGDLSATSGTAKEYPLFRFQDGVLGIMDNYNPNAIYSTPPTQSNWGDANPDLFTEIIRYDNPTIAIGNVPAQRNGNISQVEWQVAGREKQAFSYTYDKLNRLTEAKYADIHTGNWSANGWATQIDQNNRFNETLAYDKRGNITSLTRKGVTIQENNYQNGLMASVFNTIDNLIYTYNDKNQVTQIADAVTGLKGFKHNGSASLYGYDSNGNLISDSQKGISNIEYNYLNLPIRITFSDGRKIEFIYDATGKKRRKTVINVNGTTNNYRDYIGDAEYKDGQQDIIHFSEGYVQRDATTDSDPKLRGWVYKYNLKDHLGNTRVTYSDRNGDGVVGTADIEQVNHYYAFGLNMEGPWNGASGVFKYQYNGKELNSDFGLEWNDYGARFYDAVIARWVAVDELSFLAPDWSPYRYAFNNPISYFDPDGLFETKNEAKKYQKEHDADGKIVRQKDGTYAIENKAAGTSIANDKENGVQTSVLVTPEKTSPPSIDKIVQSGYISSTAGTVRAYEPNFAERLEKGSLAGSIAYNLANPIYVTLQYFNHFDNQRTDLSGKLVDKQERDLALANGLSTVVPFLRGTATVKAAVPQGITIFSKYNAAQFSKLAKGSWVSSLSPVARGRLNRILNFGINYVNNQTNTGNGVVTISKQLTKE